MELVDVQILEPEEGTSNAVALVTLNDPARRNALSSSLAGELIDIFNTLRTSSEVGAVVLTGASPAFCAGADLGNLANERDQATSGDSEAEQRLRAIYEVFLTVANCPLPTIAAINGPAVGAGMNLALTCDVRIVARSARFESRFTALGLHPGGGHSFLLDEAIGQQPAAAMMLFGETVQAVDAVRLGLAWSLVEDDLLLDETIALAHRAASVPRELSERVKNTLRRAATLASYSEAIDLEVGEQIWSISQPFFAERLTAMQAKISH
jgi:enoyl-CoA hydratase